MKRRSDVVGARGALGLGFGSVPFSREKGPAVVDCLVSAPACNWPKNVLKMEQYSQSVTAYRSPTIPFTVVSQVNDEI